MRVTQSMLTANTLHYSQASYQRLSTLQEQMSTQKKISRFSQDPVIAGKSMQYRESIDQLNQYQRNLSEAHNRLDQSDASLRETSQIITRIRELAVKASTDTFGADERKSIAQEVEQLTNHLVTIANTNSAGKYIFNGELSNVPPLKTLNPAQVTEQDFSEHTVLFYNGDTYSYEGNGLFESESGEQITFNDGQLFAGDEPIQSEDVRMMNNQFATSAYELELQQGINITVGADAHRLFTTEFFSDLFQFQKALLDPNVNAEDLDTFVGKADNHLRVAADVNGQLGARMNRVDLIEDRLNTQQFLLEKIKSENEDVDFEETVMKLLVAETIHSAALAASARVLQPSLLDFLR
ncbi:flagellar hook-associated protein FlgL [Shouchella miscanthi]|uniref:Flagellar hook-associated protein FlgL n=1 Tax=Shouchella miscanthi TaxID=2598861 RepID=A0ABU6NLE5_9BACI|nr:flagellar hook-associated protein FlgL [Shouchella miscanthi]MED4129033.1 flagellar hook-associated protein FlgL [Shouchella miscanthi]